MSTKSESKNSIINVPLSFTKTQRVPPAPIQFKNVDADWLLNFPIIGHNSDFGRKSDQIERSRSIFHSPNLVATKGFESFHPRLPRGLSRCPPTIRPAIQTLYYHSPTPRFPPFQAPTEKVDCSNETDASIVRDAQRISYLFVVSTSFMCARSGLSTPFKDVDFLFGQNWQNVLVGYRHDETIFSLKCVQVTIESDDSTARTFV